MNAPRERPPESPGPRRARWGAAVQFRTHNGSDAYAKRRLARLPRVEDTHVGEGLRNPHFRSQHLLI